MTSVYSSIFVDLNLFNEDVITCKKCEDTSLDMKVIASSR